LVDLDQLIERTSYKPSKQSMHFSIRALVNRGFIEKGAREKRRGAVRIVYRILPLGQHFVVHKTASFVSSVEDDATLMSLESTLG